MTRESALVLVVRAVEPIVSDVRLRHDPAAALGVPPHITLLYPWREPPLADHDLDAVRSALRDVRPYSITFREVGRFERMLFLRPDDQGETVGLIGRLVASFPEHPPYGGRFREPIPHLTVAEVDGGLDSVVDADAPSLVAALPIAVDIVGISVLECGQDGRWVECATIPFGGAR